MSRQCSRTPDGPLAFPGLCSSLTQAFPPPPSSSPAGQDWHHPQLSGWYKKLMRDEVSRGMHCSFVTWMPPATCT